MRTAIPTRSRLRKRRSDESVGVRPDREEAVEHRRDHTECPKSRSGSAPAWRATRPGDSPSYDVLREHRGRQREGRVGKTTTAVYLAAAAAERGDGPVLLIDADRQASSAEWLEERPVEGVEVVEAPSERTLAKAVSRRDGLSVVDGPPGDTRLLGAAAGAADVVIIPTRAAGVEISPVLSTLELIPSKTPRGVVITAARLGTNDLDETIAFWAEKASGSGASCRSESGSRPAPKRASFARGSSTTTVSFVAR